MELSEVAFDMSTEVIVTQKKKARSPMDVTKDGTSTDVSKEQDLKASLPMDVTESGISTDTNAGHELKATSGISVKLVTPGATVKLTRVLVIILESAAVKASMLNAVGVIPIVVLSIKVTVTGDGDGGCILSVIVTDP